MEKQTWMEAMEASEKLYANTTHAILHGILTLGQRQFWMAEAGYNFSIAELIDAQEKFN